MFLQNAGIYLQVHMTLQTRRHMTDQQVMQFLPVQCIRPLLQKPKSRTITQLFSPHSIFSG
jgi:hypothetical protein